MISGQQNPKANIFKLVHDWLYGSKDRWLLVLDNVDDASFLVDVPIAQRDEAVNLGSAPKPLRSYIWYSERCSVLITTRNQDAALQLVERRNIISIQPMNEYCSGFLVSCSVIPLTPTESKAFALSGNRRALPSAKER